MGQILAFNKEVILVSDRDLKTLSRYSWHTNGGYARAYKDGKSIKMHRIIMSPPATLEVDHINGNPLDNRRENLRIVTHAQNQANRTINSNNSSGYKGVSFDSTMSRKKRWQARIHHQGKSIRIGRYLSAKEAADAYDKTAIRLKGQFARLNFGRIAS